MSLAADFRPAPILPDHLLASALVVQKTISTRLRTEKPQKSPSVPPTLATRSSVVMVAVRTMRCATFSVR